MLLKNGFILTLLLASFLFASAQESPVQGDDLLKCLGQNRNSDLPTQLNNFIGNKDSKEDISFLNYGKGIQINIEQNIVKTIDLYNGDNPYSTEFKNFPGKLPLNLSFDNTIHQAKMNIGEGYEVSGDVMSTYQIIKIFKLNDDDDYRLTVEFGTGRMTMCSVAFVEGGAATGEGDAEGEGKGSTGPKFKGNDFFTMIKKNAYNFEFQQFKGQFNYPTKDDNTKTLYIQDGVDVRYKDGIIQSITLYSGGQTSDYNGMKFEPYKLDLPYGMRMENSQDAVIKKLGPPAGTEGNMLIYRERNVELQIAFKGDDVDFVKIKLAETKK